MCRRAGAIDLEKKVVAFGVEVRDVVPMKHMACTAARENLAAAMPLGCTGPATHSFGMEEYPPVRLKAKTVTSDNTD